jgi:hypothetical protein
LARLQSPELVPAGRGKVGVIHTAGCRGDR